MSVVKVTWPIIEFGAPRILERVRLSISNLVFGLFMASTSVGIRYYRIPERCVFRVTRSL